MDKIDFKKTMKELYRATSKVERVKPGEAAFLAVDGQGSPGGEAFSKGDSRPLPGRLHREIFSEKGGDDRLCRSPAGGALVR